MIKLRLAILGAAATLALGTAGAMAMTESGAGDSDSHGDAVASAARNCPHGASGVHGHCVSAIASTEGQENESSDQKSTTAPGQVCKAADASENSAETAPAKGDRAAKGSDRTEDKAEQQAFVACVTSHAAALGS
jgi:hypothetical protein